MARIVNPNFNTGITGKRKPNPAPPAKKPKPLTPAMKKKAVAMKDLSTIKAKSTKKATSMKSLNSSVGMKKK